MTNDWINVNVGDVFDLENGYAFKSADFIENGIPVIKIKNIKAGEFSEHDFSYVSPCFIDRHARKLAQFGDLLISMSGNRHDGSPETWVGKVAQFRKSGFYFLNQRVGALRVKPQQRVDPRFASYVLSAIQYQKLFISIATSSGGQANLSPKQIFSAPFSYPPLPEQLAIAHILGTLDDKIELNRKQNETLEAMARAMFKAWFVDFEPVRAKMSGRWQRGQSLPGLPAHLYDLFPNRLVESELGEIPEGWEYSSIGDEVEVCGGGTPSTKDPSFWTDGKYHWTTPKDLSSLNTPVLFDTERRITDEGLARISSGLLPRGTVLLSSRAPIGYLAIAEVPTAINQGFIAMKCNRKLPNVFVLQWCKENMSLIKSKANGSTFQEISKANFKPLPVLVPNRQVLDIFANNAGQNYAKIVKNEEESFSLQNTRDALLPKLLSGNVRLANM